MKKLLATLTLAAAVAAAPAVAQTYASEPTGEPATTSSTSSTESTAAMMTMTGTVVSSNATELVLATSQGQKTFQLSDLSTPPVDLSVGAQVTVHYRDVDGQMVATHLVVGQGAQDTGAWAAAPPAPADEDPMTGAPSADQDPATAAELEAGAKDDDEALPATASDVPLMALIGALALVAAVVLRRIH